MSTRNQREQLIHSATWQISIIVGVFIATWLYTVPLYTNISEWVTDTNIAIDKYLSTSKDWISYDTLIQKLKENSWKTDLLDIIESAPIATQEVIKKVGWAPYLTWLDENITSSSDEKNKLTIKKARLNSILPTLSPISNNLIEETINMKKYISFIETNILKEFELDSNAALWIQAISYWKKGTDTPEEIGSFNTELTFKSTNANISKLIDYINSLGHPEILLETGSIINETPPEVMSNPLAIIDTLSLNDSLDMNNPNAENNGRVVIKFYVRGSSTSDVTLLSETIRLRREDLGKKITDLSKKCSLENTCSHKKEFETLTRKFDEFSRVTKSIKLTPWIEWVYKLSDQLDSIISLENELKKITGK